MKKERPSSAHKRTAPPNDRSSPGEPETNSVNQVIKIRIEAIRREVQSKRFLGQEPSIKISSKERLEDLLAKFQVAHDLNAGLVWDHQQYFPGEKQAQVLFYSGVNALNFWNFSQASDRFERSGRLTRDPLLAQRLTLFQYLLSLLQTLFDIGPYGKIEEKILKQTQQVLEQLDQLPPQEREHYREEIKRLASLAQKMAQDDLSVGSLWHFVRARSASMESERFSAVLWLVALDGYLTRHQVNLEKTEYLTQLLLSARQFLTRLLDPQAPDLHYPTGDRGPIPRFWDLHDAFVPAVEATLGLDVQQGISQFRIQPFIPPPAERMEKEDEQTS